MPPLRRVGYEGQVVNELGGNGDVTGSPTIDTANARSGKACLKIPSAAASAYHRAFNVNSVAGTTAFTRVYFKFAEATSANQVVIMRSTPNGVERGTIRLEKAGTLSLYNSAGTKVGESSAQVEANRYYRIELETMVSSEAGKGTLGFYLDGVEIARSTAQEMGTSVVNAHVLWGKFTAATAPNMYCDDVAINTVTAPGAGALVALWPVADSARAAGWLAGAGGTTNLWDALNAAPPAGVVIGSATNTSQVKNAVSATTENLDLELAKYTDAVAEGGGGLSETDKVVLVMPIARGGNSTITARRMGIGMVSNPTIATNTETFTVSGTAAASDPTGWQYALGTISESPSVTLGTRPVLRLNKATASTDSLMFDQAYLVVEYVPSSVTPANLTLSAAAGVGGTSLALSAPTQIPLGAAAGAGGTAVALTAPTQVPLQASAGLGGTALKLTAPTQIPLQASAGLASTALALSAPALVALGLSAGVGATSMALRAPTVVPLAAAAGVGATALALTAPTVIPLGAAAGIGASALALSAPTYVLLGAAAGAGNTALLLSVPTAVPLQPSHGVGATTLLLTAIGPAMIAPAPAAGVGSTALALFAPTRIALAPSAGDGATSMELTAPSLVVLAPSEGMGATVLALTTAAALHLDPAEGTGDTTMALSAPVLLALFAEGSGSTHLILRVGGHLTNIGTGHAGAAASGEAVAGVGQATARLAVIGASAKLGEEP